MTFPKSFQVGGSLPIPLTISTKTADYTVVSSDSGTILNFTVAATVSLTAAAALGAGFNCTIWNNNTSAAVVTIDPSGAETIDGVATLILRQGEGTQIVCDGTNFQTGNKKTMRLYAENTANTSTRPVASGTTSSVAIGRNAAASGQRSSAFGDFASATATQALAVGQSTNADSNYSTALGTNSSTGGSQTTVGAGAMALGGSYASGADSFAAAIGSNSSSYGATGTSSVAIGNTSKASAAFSSALGARAGIASGTGGSVVIGGYGCEAQADTSYAFGHRGLAAYVGKYAYGIFGSANVGTLQGGYMVLGVATTDATATKLGSDGGAGGATNQCILANNQAMVVTGSILCRQKVADSDKASGWTFSAVIRRGANAGTTALVAAVTPVLIAQDVSLATTAVSVTADTTNGGLSITVTGIAATNLRWVATVNSSEAVYA